MKKTLVDKLPFEIDARIPLQLGRESISSSMVALSELVKNSYDADATKVTLKFSNLDTNNASLVISDNGIGMNEKSFKENWLRIGTTNKTREIHSKKLVRVLTGAKGLGRLGVDRLSKDLVLHTKTKTSKIAYELNIHWNKYEKEGVLLSQVKHSLYECEIPIKYDSDVAFSNKSDEGTRLNLVGLKDKWDITLLLQLRQQLSFLVSPYSGIGDFDIEIKSGFKEVDGIINSESVLEAAEWKIEAYLKNNNNVSIKYEDSVRKKKYSIDSVPWSEFMGPEGGGEEPLCGPLIFSMYYIPWVSTNEFDTPSFNKKDIKKFMESNSGIRIYRDNFRVRPYGEPDSSGDWLDLSHRVIRSPGGIAQGGWRVGPHQVVGAVQITRINNTELNDQTNREGIVESTAFNDMRKFVISVVEGFELRAHKAAKKEKQKKAPKIQLIEERVIAASEKSKFTLDDIKSTLEGIQSPATDRAIPEFSSKMIDVVTKINKLELEIKEVESANKESKQAYEEKSKELETEKNTLANLASLGILSVAFGHETTQYAIGAAGNAKQLKNSFEKGKIQLGNDHEVAFSESIETIIRNTSFIKNFSKFYLSSVRPSRRKRKAVPVSNVLNRTSEVLAPSLDRQNIDIDIEFNGCEGIKVSAFEIDIESIFVNLFTNSIQAMSKTPKAKRLIKVDFSEDDENLKVVFSDSGSGISKLHLGSVFDPMFSTKKDRKGNQEGTGMGLTIIKTIVEDHIKGSISVNTKGKLKGAEFILTMPIKRKKRIQ